MDWDKNAVVCAGKSKVKIPVAKQDNAAAKRSLSIISVILRHFFRRNALFGSNRRDHRRRRVCSALRSIEAE